MSNYKMNYLCQGYEDKPFVFNCKLFGKDSTHAICVLVWQMKKTVNVNDYFASSDIKYNLGITTTVCTLLCSVAVGQWLVIPTSFRTTSLYK